MSASTLGLRMSVAYDDADLLEVLVLAGNGRFFATTTCWCTRRDIEGLRSGLAGFPVSRADVREVELGSSDRGSGHGGIRLRLECVDSAGHGRACVHAEQDGEPKESATLSFEFEPAMVDSFVEELAALALEDPDHAAVAHLRATA